MSLPRPDQFNVTAILLRVLRASASDRIALTSAGCAFYAMLALFPGIFLLISLFGIVFDAAAVEPQLEVLRELVPEDTFEMIASRVHDLVEAPRPRLEWSAILSASIAIWSASAGTRATIGALNMAHDVEESRPFFRYHALAIGLTLGATLAAVIAIAALVALPGILALFGLPALRALSLRGLSLLTLLLLIGLSLLAVYRLGPASRRLPIRRILPGVFLATLLWALGSAAFSLYVSDFATYDAMYGPLGATVGLLMWFYVSVYVVLLGAELNVALATQAGAW